MTIDRYRLRIRLKPAARAALEWYLKRATWTDDGGHSFQGFTLMDLGAAKTLEAAVESEIPMPDVLKRRIVSQALGEWYRTSRKADDMAALEQALRVAAETLASRCRPFTVLTLWNVRSPTAVGLEANGLTTRLVGWDELQDVALDSIWQRAADFWMGGARPAWLIQDGDKVYPVSSFTPALTTVEAPDSRTSIELVSDSADLIRAVLSRPRAMRVALKWSSLPAPLGALLSSPIWTVLRDDHSIEDVAFGLASLHEVRPVELKEEELAAARESLRDLSTGIPSPSVAAFKSRVLRLYQAALDADDRQSQFLAFWQVLEAVTLTEPAARDQVENRLVTLLGLEGDSLASHLARAMAALRHDLVHRGSYPVADTELPFVLKWVADSAIARTFKITDQLGGMTELKDWFQLATRSDADLERLTRVAGEIVAQRTPKSSC